MISSLEPLQPIDYLVVGHITLDITPEGKRLGGTATYAALTARALGFRVGVVTAYAGELPLDDFEGVAIYNYACEQSTAFENLYTPQGRRQKLHALAPRLDYYMVPEPWRNAAIVHLGPVAQEVEPSMVRNFSSSLVGVTPQGWLRQWNELGEVQVAEWLEAAFVLGRAGAAVISSEDVGNDEKRIEEMSSYAHILAVTEAAEGVQLFWNGDVRRFPAPHVEEVDATGAGDIFAAAFFIRLYTTRDPWEAARFATLLSAFSVQRRGLLGVPTSDEVQACMVEVL